MALVNFLKIGSDGLQSEHDSSTDELNLADYQLGGTSLSGVSGDTVLGSDSSAYTNIVPGGDTIRDVLLALDSAIDQDSFEMTNGEAGAMSLGDAVYISGNDTVMLADNSDTAKDDPIGVVAEASISSSSSGQITMEGVVEGMLTGATAGDKYFLDSTPGGITTVVPTGSGNNIVLMGFAKNATDFLVRVTNIGRRA